VVRVWEGVGLGVCNWGFGGGGLRCPIKSK
jgi:hypothetical protein